MEFLEKTPAATKKRCQIESDSCPFFSQHLYLFFVQVVFFLNVRIGQRFQKKE